MGGEEMFPLVDEAGNVTGKASRSECHSGSKLLHPVVHLHVFDRQGRLFLQQRSMSKDIQPGKWDTAVGGHVNLGETVDAALVREAKEELGLALKSSEKLFAYVFESEIERELVNSFRCEATLEDLQIDKGGELADGRFFELSEVEERLGTGFFTPNFEQEYAKLKRLV